MQIKEGGVVGHLISVNAVKQEKNNIKIINSQNIQTEVELTHSRSAALSIFMKSCLARSKISGSSLEVICSGAA